MHPLQAGARVRVHKNLQRGDWSVTVKGVVIANVSEIVLSNVTFKYWQGGYQRITAAAAAGKPRRRVCAWAEGVIRAAVPDGARTPITYNPYRSSKFTTRDGCSIEFCAAVHFTAHDGAVAIGDVK